MTKENQVNGSGSDPLDGLLQIRTRSGMSKIVVGPPVPEAEALREAGDRHTVLSWN